MLTNVFYRRYVEPVHLLNDDYRIIFEILIRNILIVLIKAKDKTKSRTT